MKRKIFVISIFIICSQVVSAQTPKPQTNSLGKTNQSEFPPTKTDDSSIETTRLRREQAYIKLLEGQRRMLNLSRQRSEVDYLGSARIAKDALQKAVELDPTLAEAYTALAEITLSSPPNDVEQSILLANTAVKINSENYGGHRILARLYTIKSKLNRGNMDADFAAKAISEWKEIARLDSQNAEAFAFLSEFYAETNKVGERIDALRKWLAAGEPLEPGFYQTFIGGGADLAPESAAVKLGEVLLDDGRTSEAIEILSRSITENPESSRAKELLREAVETADEKSSANAAASLSRAVLANPANVSLISLLAQVLAHSGKIDDAAQVLRNHSANFAEKDADSAAYLQIVLGDIYAGAGRFDDAVAGYEAALLTRGISVGETTRDDERDFAIRVFEKMIQTQKNANRAEAARTVIARARAVLGKEDTFADRQLISIYRETGKTAEALQTVRSVRAKNAGDYSLLRLEATILTGGNKVDEAVALVKTLINKKNSPVVQDNGVQTNGGAKSGFSLPVYDDFTNYIFISNLYAQAKRGREAVESANQAAANALGSSERKQIAKLTLATAQQTAGNFLEAEAILRELLQQTPGNPIALNNLGYFLVERDRKLTEALELILQAVKIDRTNPSYLDSLGWAYYKLEKFAEAEKYMKEAARFDSASATIQEHLGDVYHKREKFDLAKSAWQKSLMLAVEKQQAERLKSKISKGR